MNSLQEKVLKNVFVPTLIMQRLSFRTVYFLMYFFICAGDKYAFELIQSKRVHSSEDAIH